MNCEICDKPNLREYYDKDNKKVCTNCYYEKSMNYYRVNFGQDSKLYCISDNIAKVQKYANLIDKYSKVSKINFIPKSASLVD